MRRIDAARAVRKWPLLLGKISSGELSLTVLGKLKPFLSEENVGELTDAVSGLSVREAERILAVRFPKPDVADSIRTLPSGARTVQTVLATSPTTSAAGASASGSGVESSEALPATNTTNGAVRSAPTGTHTDADAASRTVARSETGAAGVAAHPDEARSTSEATGGKTRPAPRPVDRGSFQPLSAERIQVKFTASRELEEKIALARDLMSHRNPRGDLATIFEAGLDVWIADALKKKLGVTERAQRKKRPTKRERVTNATRREVLDRDGLGCAFMNEDGKRCGARAFLELDHEQAKGRGGSSGPANMRLLCRAHNQGEAERVYGKAHMDRSRRAKSEDGVREPTPTHEFITGFPPAPTRIPVLGWPVERVCPRRQSKRDDGGRPNVDARAHDWCSTRGDAACRLGWPVERVCLHRRAGAMVRERRSTSSSSACIDERELRLRLPSLWLDAETMRRAFGWDPDVRGR